MDVAAIAPVFVHSSQKRRKNTWYSFNNGNWTDPNTWVSNAMSMQLNNFNYPGQFPAVPIFPQVGDDVYINHAVTVNGALNITINNLYVSGSLLFDNSGIKTINVKGDVQAVGTVDLSSTQVVNFNVAGTNNYIVNFISGSNSVFGYVREGDQEPLLLAYRSLLISGIGTKTPQGGLTISGNLTISTGATLTSAGNTSVAGNTIVSGMLNLETHDWIFTGTTNATAASPSRISKVGAGSVLFIGRLSAGSAATTHTNVDFRTGNPSVEVRGGLTWSSNTPTAVPIQGGLGLWSFTTNNQTIFNSGASPVTSIFHDVLLVNILLEVQLTERIQINNSIDGTTGTSELRLNTGKLLLNTNIQPMITGILNLSMYANTVTYMLNGNITLWHTAYSSLEIYSSGIKTVAGNTTVTGDLLIGMSLAAGVAFYTGELQLSTYDLTVTGSTRVTSQLKKSGAGNVIFIGPVMLGNASSTLLAIDFTGGNPTVEVRSSSGVYAGSNAAAVYLLNGGTGLWTFTTNNQNWGASGAQGGGAKKLLFYDIMISGAITLNTNVALLEVTNSINGNNAGSKFDSRSSTEYKGAAIPMATGIFDCDAGANIFKYNGTGNQAVRGGNYRTLELGGSGVKQLQGNVDWITAYSLTGAASVDLNGFTLS